MKQFSVEGLAFGVKSSFGAKRNAAIGLTLNAKRRALNLGCFISETTVDRLLSSPRPHEH
jgi:hypothetical protein